MSRARRKIAVWIALAALLFSALSPAMASVLFSDRPDILARVLALPAKPAVSEHADICRHDAAGVAHRGNAEHSSEHESGHAAHGIFCSFCLAASSVVTLATAANAVVMAVLTTAVYLPNGHVQPPAANPAATRHPRDPPASLR